MAEFIITVQPDHYTPDEWRKLWEECKRIVRCRNCMWCHDMQNEAYVCTLRTGSWHTTQPDGFCHMGQIKEAK